MFNTSQFDEFNDTTQISAQPPFAFAKDGKELVGNEEVHEWLKKEATIRIENSRNRVNYYRRNRAMFKGIHHRLQSTRTDNGAVADEPKKPKMVVNFVQEMVESKVSKRAESKPSLDPIPQSNDLSDINNVKIIDKLVEHRYSEVDIDSVYSELDKKSFLDGESYIFPVWDDDEGELHPSYQRLLDKYEDIKNIKDKGLRKLMSKPIHVGDVIYPVYPASRVLPQEGRTDWKKVDDVITIDYISIHELKAEYPSPIYGELRESDDGFRYDNESMQEKKLDGEVVKFTYYHRKNKWMQKGKKIIFTESALLEVKDIGDEYKYKQLPCLPPLKDIVVEDEIHGRSFIQNIVQLQNHFNNLASATARNHGVTGSAPKWFLPKGSAKVKSLQNDVVVCEYAGPVPPKLIASNTTSPEVFNYMDKLERYIEKGSVVYSTSRGEPPKGVTAEVAMQFLDEQEEKRESQAVSRRYSIIKEIYKRTAQIMSVKYKADDGRMIRILGDDNEYLIENFKEANFKALGDVKIKHVSSLPTSKTGRISTIVNLNNATNTDPQGPVFKREEIIQMLDLGLDEAFTERSTISVKAAQTNLDKIIRGEEPSEPQISDDLIIHHGIFTEELESRTFRDLAPSKMRDVLIQHITTIEGLMYLRAKKIPMFAQKIQMMDNYPLFFELPPELPMPAQQMQQQGAPAAGADTSKMPQASK